MTPTEDTMSQAHAERSDLADLLRTLTPEQWEAPTLCAAWRVRDVVAHTFSYEELSMLGVVGRLLRAGLDSDRANEIGVAACADRTPDELLAMVHEHLDPSGLTAKFGGRIALTDGLIHHQDIRRPLGLHRSIPPGRLVTALDFARPDRPSNQGGETHPRAGPRCDRRWLERRGRAGRRRPRGAPADGHGRRVAINELSGPGRSTLADRLST
jgi:uncharacterized protein (TIGR03083 family)